MALFIMCLVTYIYTKLGGFRNISELGPQVDVHVLLECGLTLL